MPEGEEWIDAWLSSISDRTAQTRQLAERVAGVAVTASSVDGAVEVTVSSSGALTDLRLDEQVRTWPAEQIAAEILTVQREAQRRLADRVAQVGGESMTTQAMVADLRQRFGSDDGQRLPR